MINLIGRKVSNVRLHSPYHVKGLGEIKAVLNSGDFNGTLTMIKTETGLFCTAGKLKLEEFFIPDSNCIGFTLEAVKEQLKESNKK